MTTKAGKKTTGPKTVTVPEVVVVKKGDRPSIEDPYAEKKPSALDMLADAAEEIDQELAVATDNLSDDDKKSIVELAEEMQAEQEEFQRLEAEAKQHKDRYNEIRTRALPDAMRQAGIVDQRGRGSFTFTGGRVHLENRLNASCAAANKPGLFEWLRENGHGDIIKADVHQQTLTSFVKEQREKQLPDPPGISVWEETKAKITRTK